MSSGVEQLEQLAARLEDLKNVPTRAAPRALAEVLKVARAEWSSGKAPDETGWDGLKHKGGTPLASQTSQNTGATRGAGFVISTPNVLKYHQGGYPVHTGGAGERLREAKASVKRAIANADAERLKIARKDVRDIKKKIRKEATRVVARRTLPGRRAMPVAWGQAIQRALDEAIARTLGGAS